MSKPIEKLLDECEWAEVPPPKEHGDLPYVTHSGVLRIGGVELDVYRLSDGLRIISSESFGRYLGAFFSIDRPEEP